MIKLLVIADDFTGAIDTAVKFSKKGIKTKVISDNDYKFPFDDSVFDVVAINTETRHTNPEIAYKTIFSIVNRAIQNNVQYIYKKTDSVLRGNIGSELNALINASCSTVCFIPAYPLLKRTTKNSVQLYNNIEVHITEFGCDLYQPLKTSYIPDIINEQSNTFVNCITDLKNMEIRDNYINIFDTQTEQDMIDISLFLSKHNVSFLAGCGGFAEHLDKIINFNKVTKNTFAFEKRMLVLCGSINPISKRQVEYAVNNGFKKITLSIEQLTDNDFLKSIISSSIINDIDKLYKLSNCLIIETCGVNVKHLDRNAQRLLISENLGKLFKLLLNNMDVGNVLITGGDTLYKSLLASGIVELIDLDEIMTGIVIAKTTIVNKPINVISKSGGFGSESLFVDIMQRIEKGNIYGS